MVCNFQMVDIFRFGRYFLFVVLMVFNLAFLGCAGKKATQVEQELLPEFSVECAASDPASCVWPDESLKKSFIRYWNLRSSGPLDELLSMEAPFFQYVVRKGKYENFFAPGFSMAIDRIDVYRVEIVNENLVDMSFDVKYADRKRGMGLQSRWVRINDRWYHVQQNQLIFPEVP